nr:MAG TPA: hypothetical protein [Caudoviricetes sp.]
MMVFYSMSLQDIENMFPFERSIYESLKKKHRQERKQQQQY